MMGAVELNEILWYVHKYTSKQQQQQQRWILFRTLFVCVCACMCIDSSVYMFTNSTPNWLCERFRVRHFVMVCIVFLQFSNRLCEAKELLLWIGYRCRCRRRQRRHHHRSCCCFHLFLFSYATCLNRWSAMIVFVVATADVVVVLFFCLFSFFLWMNVWNVYTQSSDR